MKAYMSTGTHHDSFGYIAQARLKAQSYDEAKRILADVEPLSEGYHFHIKSQSPWLPITDEDELLAEALENFIETLDKMGH